MNSLKKYGKGFLCKILEWQVGRLRLRNEFLVVGVVGSVGKTSTKMSIAKILNSKSKTRYQEGNYNDRLTVPLVFFGHSNPSMFNLLAWLKIFISNERQIKNWNIKYVVAELGTDEPGQIKDFAYIKPDISVVTAITPEHMLQFGSLDAVAKEELTVAEFSKKVIINIDDTDKKYLKSLNEYISAGLDNKADYTASTSSGHIKISGPNRLKLDSKINLLGKQGAKTVLLVVSAINELGLKVSNDDIKSLRAFNGRMNQMRGIKQSLIIDDTYNSSPAAVVAALDVIYDMPASQKIAILGSMNELGNHEKSSHIQIGKYCDPKNLDLVVTIGGPAQQYLAVEAEARGCQVMSFSSPFDAGEYVASMIKKGALILAKGSQNQVFAEESLKFLLEDPKDKKHLVRQSDYWLKIKEQQFGRRID